MHVKHILYIQNGSTKALECLCIPHRFAKKFKSNSSKIESVLRMYLFNSAALNPANIQGNLINHFHFRSNKMRTVDSFAFLNLKAQQEKKKKCRKAPYGSCCVGLAAQAQDHTTRFVWPLTGAAGISDTGSPTAGSR